MTIELRRIQFQPDRLPAEIQLVISDAKTEEESQVWISARFPLGKRDADRLPLLVREAFLELKSLVDEGMEHAARAPCAPN